MSRFSEEQIEECAIRVSDGMYKCFSPEVKMVILVESIVAMNFAASIVEEAHKAEIAKLTAERDEALRKVEQITEFTDSRLRSLNAALAAKEQPND